jgi:hypothetical protein
MKIDQSWPKPFRSSPGRSNQVVDMTGLQPNHVSWKDREIERALHPLADLCLEAEPLELVEHLSRPAESANAWQSA